MKTVFIVDDKPTNLLVAKKALEDTFKTYALPSAEKMFHLMNKITPDLILLDVEMPDMNGFEAIQILRNDDKYRTIPVIFLTGKNDEASEIKGFELGAIDFIHKPFSATVLQKRIEIHIEIDRLTKVNQIKNDELMKANEAKDNILAVVSHDLKNYITGIELAVEVINSENSKLSNHKFIKLIGESAQRMFILVKEILSTSKLDFELSFIEFNINEVIEECSENLIMMAKRKNIDLTFELYNEPIFCMLNIEQFQRAIDNICINAIKFTNPSGKIIIKTNLVNNQAQISITDTGIGMTKEIIENLFEKYTKSGRKGTAGEASTGLGLYIVKQIIRAHNGTVEVFSEEGRGSEFLINIPTVND